MKLGLYFIFWSFISFSAFSQVYPGMNIGGNISYNKIRDLPSNMSTSNKYGVNTGLFVSFEGLKWLYIRPGVKFSQKGYKLTEDSLSLSTEYNIRINYLEMPLHFIVPVKVGRGQLMMGGGPFFGYGLGGYRKETYSYSSSKYQANAVFTTEVNDENFFSFDADDEKFYRYDWGIDFILGYRFDNTALEAGYTVGLRNINPPLNTTFIIEPRTPHIRTRYWRVSLYIYIKNTKGSSQTEIIEENDTKAVDLLLK